MAKRDLGSRVVVRRRVGARFTDLLGELMELSETHLTVATLSGPVRVPLDEVHRAKRVPDVMGVERAAAEAMPAPVLEWLGQWRLRAAQGFTGRANSALPLGSPGMPIPDALDAVIDFYHRHGLPPQMDVPLPLGRPVARALTDHGWTLVTTSFVRVIDLPDLLENTPPGERFTLAPRPSDKALAMISARKGVLPEAAHHVLTAVPKVTFCEYQEGGSLLAMARGTVTRGWLGLFHIETAPQARRRGLAREAIGALARWAGGEAARHAYLQVEDGNAAALALYDALGFAPHHTFARYRAP